MLSIFLLFSFLFDAIEVGRIAWSNCHCEEVVENDIVQQAKSDGAPGQAQLRAQPFLEHWRHDQEKGVDMEAEEDIEAKAKTEAEDLHYYPKRLIHLAEQLIYQRHF